MSDFNMKYVNAVWSIQIPEFIVWASKVSDIGL